MTENFFNSTFTQMYHMFLIVARFITQKEIALLLGERIRMSLNEVPVITGTQSNRRISNVLPGNPLNCLL